VVACSGVPVLAEKGVTIAVDHRARRRPLAIGRALVLGVCQLLAVADHLLAAAVPQVDGSSELALAIPDVRGAAARVYGLLISPFCCSRSRW
jgi:hypothetical protein